MSTPDPDPSVVELSLEFAGLQISVRGAPDQAASFVAQVAALPSGSERPASASTGGGYGASSAVSSRSVETRDSILASFPACPGHLLALATRRLGGPRPYSEGRARRAWIAGNWAKAVLAGRVASPNRTQTIDLANRFWVVVRSSRCRVPRIFTTSAAYFQAVGNLEEGNSVSQAFPSETEAKIYLEAAGLQVSEFN